MIRHVASYTWKEGTGAADIQALSEALARLPGLVPDIRAFHFGPDLGVVEGNADFALVADFDDLEAYQRYRASHPHQRLITHLLQPILESRSGVQFTVEDAAPG